MLSNLIFSLNNTVPIFAVMLLGFVLKHYGVISDRFVADANKFVFYVSLPVMLFADLAETDVRASFDGPFLLFCAGTTFLSIVVIWGLARKLIRNKSLVGEFVQGSYRSSAAILGVAFIKLIYGTADMSGLMILGCVPLYNIFAVLILVVESPKQPEEISLPARIGNTAKRIATNPIILGIVLGFAVSLLRVPMPKMLTASFDKIGELTTLAVLAIGAGFKGKEAFGEGKLALAATLIKLVVLPAIFLPLAVYMGFTGQKFVALLVMLGSITTPASYVMAKQMGHEGTLAGSICVLTTLLCPITLTMWLFLASCMNWL